MRIHIRILYVHIYRDLCPHVERIIKISPRIHLQKKYIYIHTLQHSAIHCNTLQHTATSYSNDQDPHVYL